jgi:putative membrane protein insertion efficiency factor
MKKILIWLIARYKKYISPKMPDCCRFEPTCSVYAMEAIEEWGCIRGGALALWRIIRCNPFCKAGEDPVPRKNKQGDGRIDISER